MSEADHAGGQAEERLVDVVAALPADAQTAHAVVPGDRALNDPPEHTEPRAVLGSALGDLWVDPPIPQLVAVFGGVVGTIGIQRIGPLTRPATSPTHRRDRLHQR